MGFGWSNVSVYKAGAIYRHDERLTLRLGWNGSEQTTSSDQVLFGLISPATFRNHLTAGMSYRINEKTEVSLGYMHAFVTEIQDQNSPLFGAIATAKFAADALDITYNRRF
jgi:long-chain fatty acid transport protein